MVQSPAVRCGRTRTREGRVWCAAALLVLAALAAAPAGAQMRVLSGSYTGNGVDNRAVTVGFQPDVVVVKREPSGSEGVVRTSTMVGDLTKPLVNPTAAFAGGVKSLSATGFVLGTNAAVNANGSVYHWIAFKAAAGQMAVGTYQGDGNDNRDIATVGFQPDVVWVLSQDAYVGAFRTSSMSADTTYYFDSGFNANWVQQLIATGFQVGNANEVNSTAGATDTYHWVAWKNTTGRIRAGFYDGDGSTNRDLPIVGFQPEWVLVKRDDNLRPWVHKPESTGAFTNASLYFTSTSTVQTDDITRIRSLGFEVTSGGTDLPNDRVNGNGVKYHYVAFGPDSSCCGLTTAEGAGTVTVTGTGSFEIGFSEALGGGIDRFYDLVEDPTKANDLVGGVSEEHALLGLELQSAPSGTWYETDQANAYSKAHLLEATPTRVRVRQESFLSDTGTSWLGGSKAVGDHSIYGVGRSALRWTWTSANPLSYYERDINLGTHWTGTGNPQFKPCADGLACWTSPGTGAEDFVLHAWNMSGARTDFLTILSADWAQATSLESFGLSASPDEWYWTGWLEGSGTPSTPASQSWNLLTYFKPTNFVDHTDAAVTSRVFDYRIPDPLSVTVGQPWIDAAQLTAGGDDFNEAEGAYLLTLDPSLGLTFELDGSVATPRRSPFFKIRQWRSLLDAPVVRLNGSLMTKDGSYRADVKPLSRAHWASTLNWHCTMESTTACDSANIDVGVGVATAASGTTATTGRYGNGLLFTANTDRITAGSSDFSASIGAIDFWYQPRYASNDGAMHILWSWQSGSGPYNCFGLAKTAVNELALGAVVGSTDRACNIGGITYSAEAPAANLWRAYDWVHLKASWNAAGGTRKLRIVMNGVEIAFSGTYVAPPGSATPIFGGCSGVNCPGGAGANANGILDEVHIYGGLELSAYDTNTPLAHAGLTSDAGEYLADPAKNWSLGLTPVGSGRAGSYLYFGSDSPFRGLNVALTTPGVWSTTAGDLVWEFWNGTQWTTLESGYGFTDGTSDFTRNGTAYWTGDPFGWSPYSVNGGPDLHYVRLHLAAGALTYSTQPVERMVKTDVLLFQYCGDITSSATQFQFGTPATTAVKLMSFSAVPGDGSVLLEWRTGSELDNLGFHLYRGPSAEGPWTRLTASLIPGLGSSPLGQAYSWLDSGLVNGTRYYYRLEDVDTASVSTFHGPVSTVPGTASSPPGEGGEGEGGGDGAEGGEGETVDGSCPSWILAESPDAVSPTCTRHGDPDSVSLQVLARGASSATVELRTGGFWVLRDAAGEVHVFVPGLEFPTDAKAPALPLRRALVDAVVAKQVRLVSAEAFELQSFPGLRPSAVGQAEMSVSRDGTVRPTRRSLPARFLSRGLVPAEVARLAGTAFQGERKSAVVEITPVRFDGSGQKLVLAGRVRVKLSFAGVAEGEVRTGSGGRALPRRGLLREVLAHLHTTRRGLHAVRYEALFPTSSRGLSTSLLRLQRQGEAVPFHVEPAGSVFGPGSVLYFFAERTVSSTDYSGEVAYELVRGSGVRMGVASAPPLGAPAVSSSTGFASFETNRIYQPGLLEALDVWLWDAMVSGAERTQGFTLSAVETSSAEMAHLVVHLQGGSESEITPDHHVRVSVNGGLVGDSTFAGKQPYRLEVLVPTSLLKEGANELSVVNVGNTGVSSLVFLDRIEVSYPQVSTTHQGVFEGVWAEAGTVEVSGLAGLPVILRDPGQPGPEGSAMKWLTGFQMAPGSGRFRAEAGHRYLVVSPEGLLTPRIGRVLVSTLKSGTNQADYLVIGPREFLAAAVPLLERRRGQGLVSRAVSFEEIASEFGKGQPSAEAIRAFLSHAYHSWQKPSPRYVLLLGDATYDPQRFRSTSWASPLPALWAKTSYLWTASDPALGAVNGEDLLPDLAIGRLPVTTVEQAEGLIGKLLAWEDSGQGLSGKAVLVADDPDLGGDFEADVEDVRGSYLSGRATTTLKVGELGAETRPAILEAFDDGASLMSYVGHGGTAVWASENVLNSWDTPSLLAQSRQPLLLTLNCLNGYFVAPNFDALPEALLKAEGRGVIAAVSPSGLSLDGPAHQYHRAVMAELTSGAHERLGDAILAAQRTYAQTGLMPELLTVYQLLGDPAMRIR